MRPADPRRGAFLFSGAAYLLRMRWFALLVLLCGPVHAQGFAGLGTEVDGYAVPKRGTPLRFPNDHGAHPAYRIEWWYLTALLEDAQGTPFGLQWTLFRTALAPPATDPTPPDLWQSPQVWMGHAAVTTPRAHYVTERRARGDIGQAGVSVSPTFDAWIDDWFLKGSNDLSRLTLSAGGPDFSYDMTLTAQGPLVLQGDAGYSVKSAAGQASYYYSQPFFQIAGTLDLPQGPVEVNGQAWLDREWSSQPLAADQSGWDWFSLSFDSGARMMGFVLRSDAGADFTSATWIAPDGTATPYPDGALTARALERTAVETGAGARPVPTAWHLRLPDQGVDITVRALNPQSWMTTSVPYWEGPTQVTGSHTGRGYLEMTGY